MQADHPRFADALVAMDGGDVAGLRDLLVAHPELVNARATSEEAPYDGYFHGATLLHHVAGNPVRRPLPANIVEVTRTLLDAGAEPDARCGGGPAQPGPAGGTTLGLVVTGAQAHIQGVTEGLLDLLIERGAALDREAGMFGTLYHTVEHRGQREVARMLYDRGVEADLPTAAGLGNLDLVRSFLDPDGRPVPGADRIWRHSRGGTPGTHDQVLGDALVAAAANGWPDVVAHLADLGAPMNELRPWGSFPITPLHAAAWAGWPDVVALLLDRGADPSVQEPTFEGTPLGWARHSDRERVVELLERSREMSGPEAALRGAVEAADTEGVVGLLARHTGLKAVLDAPVFPFGA